MSNQNWAFLFAVRNPKEMVSIVEHVRAFRTLRRSSGNLVLAYNLPSLPKTMIVYVEGWEADDFEQSMRCRGLTFDRMSMTRLNRYFLELQLGRQRNVRIH